MIKSFNCKDTERLFHDRSADRFRSLERIARRKLLLLHGTHRLQDLRIPPGNRLETLR